MERSWLLEMKSNRVFSSLIPIQLVMRVFRFLLLTLMVLISLSRDTNGQSFYHEQYRPQIHFSPREHWTNDPNGMVYYKGLYHLFFQYYPGSSVWGPMHWVHAVSKDLIHWKQLPIALYPDSLGFIFSGSAVVDTHNTSGLGSASNPPLVAIFTSHDPKKQRAHALDYENESIAYSLDGGMTWKKYAHNPVLKNPGITDFRDPKVFWFAAEKKWVMTLATRDRVTFYSSKNLTQWKRESDFGADRGAHGGVWECPDLFALQDHGKTVWVLIVNLNPGGPNKGSATQYFIGHFDGHHFITSQTETRWVDYGPDDYAGVTWNHTGSRKIFLGWMSNWLYANQVPTTRWRNAMTFPRELSIIHVGGVPYLASTPVPEIRLIEEKPWTASRVEVSGGLDLATLTAGVQFPCLLKISLEQAADLSVVLSNSKGEKVVIGYDPAAKQYFIDRRNSGKTDFQKDFSSLDTAPRISTSKDLSLTLIIDKSSVELFGDKGLTVMTELFFPNTPYEKIEIKSEEKRVVRQLEYVPLKSIW